MADGSKLRFDYVTSIGSAGSGDGQFKYVEDFAFSRAVVLISGAINFAMPLFEANDYRGLRRVIDISGDGPNNNGDLVTIARDAAVAKGVTINGLPIMAKEVNYSTMDIENLDIYYEDCVVGGAGSFVVAIKGKEKFKEAIRTKLVLEVANRMPEPRVVPAATPKPRTDCMIGEKMWNERRGR